MIKVLVLCTNSRGWPDSVIYEVDASEKQISDGDHYAMAKDMAQDDDYEAPFVLFDENDRGGLRFLAKNIERMSA